MSLVINSFTGGGGGFSTDGAMLRVIAPTGSTVTASRTGSISKTPSGALIIGSTGNSCYYFSFSQSEYSATAWTISAVKNDESTSDTVVINAAGEYSIELSYWHGELFLNGDQFTKYTGGWVTKRVKTSEKLDNTWQVDAVYPEFNTDSENMIVSVKSTGQDNWSGSIITTNKIDFAGNGYKSIKLIGEKTTGSNPIVFYVTSTDTADRGVITPDVTSGNIYNTGDKEITLDISGLTTSVYVGVNVSSYSAAENVLQISSIVASTQSA